MTGPTAFLAEINASVTGTGSIVVGGKNLSNAVRGFTLTSRVGEVTRLELECALPADVVAGALVRVDAETHALLVDLGWTPPPDSASALPPG